MNEELISADEPMPPTKHKPLPPSLRQVPLSYLMDDLEDASQSAKKLVTSIFVFINQDEYEKQYVALSIRFPRGTPCIEVRPDGTSTIHGKRRR